MLNLLYSYCTVQPVWPSHTVQYTQKRMTTIHSDNIVLPLWPQHMYSIQYIYNIHCTVQPVRTQYIVFVWPVKVTVLQYIDNVYIKCSPVIPPPPPWQCGSDCVSAFVFCQQYIYISIHVYNKYVCFPRAPRLSPHTHTHTDSQRLLAYITMGRGGGLRNSRHIGAK